MESLILNGNHEAKFSPNAMKLWSRLLTCGGLVIRRLPSYTEPFPSLTPGHLTNGAGSYPAADCKSARRSPKHRRLASPLAVAPPSPDPSRARQQAVAFGQPTPTQPAASPERSHANVVQVESGSPRKRRGLRGFTFVEMMVVVSIIVILISMAIPHYNKAILRAKESVLKNNLFTMRTVLDNFTADKQKAPQSLSELVTEGYLSKLPVDPMTGSNQSWKTIMEEASQSVNQSEPGIFDVQSGSDKTSLDGTPYSEW
jgi:general secretion pathway protein G